MAEMPPVAVRYFAQSIETARPTISYMSRENLVVNLLGDVEFELQVPYLLYRNGSQEMNGTWFHNTCECEDVANLFTRVYEGRQSYHVKEIPQVSVERILCRGSSRKRPVLKWENNIAWPGRLTFSDKALYYEAIGLKGGGCYQNGSYKTRLTGLENKGWTIQF